MPNGRGALSGAATGAATGASIGSLFPGPGTLIGGGIGALIGGIGGAKSKQHNPSKNQQDVMAQLQQLLPILQQRATQNVTSTPGHMARQGQLNDMLQRQAGLDAQLAGQLGMGSSSFAIGQGSQRLRAAVEGTRRNVDASQGQQASDTAQLLGLLGQMGALGGQMDGARNQAVAGQGQNLALALQALTSITQKRPAV